MIDEGAYQIRIVPDVTIDENCVSGGSPNVTLCPALAGVTDRKSGCSGCGHGAFLLSGLRKPGMLAPVWGFRLPAKHPGRLNLGRSEGLHGKEVPIRHRRQAAGEQPAFVCLSVYLATISGLGECR